MHKKHGEILALLEAGELSQKEIARRLGVGPATVNEIEQNRLLGEPINVPPYRCETCRFRVVTTPCPVCKARSERAARGLKA
ncbi:MAG TPA: helix-turn-helix transcriptional regulator [Pirellulales bacterium]|jgi:tRNA(Arg) A34 adenosine deaminase TadA